ncbi:ABC transporter substrate-binding protein [Microvirga aerilata]|uniref:ABC transporter substrate-binding protein n=1 Tax=Microvirga aerilata TaxID=670292 RepID=UPI00363D27CA
MFQFTSALAGMGLMLTVLYPAAAEETRSWDEISVAARGQTVYFNAWAGDPQTNAFIAWVGDLASKRHGVTVEHAKLKDTAEAVTRVVAEKAAGRNSGGSVDLIWVNGPNFLSMKNQGLLFGPFAEKLPNWRYVDTEKKPSNLVDFTVPVEGNAVPWRMAQVVFLYDEAHTPPSTIPKSVPALLGWAKANPGRLTHPTVRDFLGATFLKQALYELTPDHGVLQSPATDDNFTKATAPLWTWYDALRPHLWRAGREFPATGTAQIQLLNDGEISLAISFNPADAAVSIKKGTLPESARVYVLDKGTIGNTSFVAIPYNAANKEAAMVVANLLLEPEVQAQAQDPKWIGSFTVLDFEKLSPNSASCSTARPMPLACPPTLNWEHPCRSHIRAG